MERLLYVSAALLLLLLAALFYIPGVGPGLEGYTEVDGIDSGGNFLVFEAGCYRLEMVVSQDQSADILRGMLNATPERPLTHDLFASTLSEAGVEVEAVRIHSLVNDSYHARLVLEDTEVDARPSDATALAVRTGAPVYVKDTLLREEGADTCERGGDEV